MKILALDMGDAWIGIAISDTEHRFSFPLQTIKTAELATTLPKLVATQEITTVIYGLPFTLRGECGTQSQKVLAQIDALKTLLPQLTWMPIDERFSSQGAREVLRQQGKNVKDTKQQEHAIVAALLLQSYLDSRR